MRAAGATGTAGAAIAARAAVVAVAAVVVVAAVLAAGAAVAAAGAGSRLSTDGCKQNERIATIRIILISSNQRWEGSFEALTIKMAFDSGLVIRNTIFIFSRCCVTVMCQIFVTVEQVGRVGSSGRLVFPLPRPPGLLGGSSGRRGNC